MKKLIIEGPSKLEGTVKVQGSKNVFLKHIFLPLLTNAVFTFSNVPDIGSIHNLLEIFKIAGISYKWTEKNSLRIDSRKMKAPGIIPQDLFYYTSAAISMIPILTSRFGKCQVEKNRQDESYGGCKIGSRSFKRYIKTLEEFGIGNKEKENEYEFFIVSKGPFSYHVPVSSYSATANAIYAALFKKGESKIIDYTREPILEFVLEAMRKAGASIKQSKDMLVVKGMEKLHGIEHKNVSDRHDFMTWIFAALSTNSKLMIENVNYEDMRLEQMEKVINNMNIKLKFDKDICLVKPQIKTIRPQNIKAGRYPDFQTEWQVLLSPLLTQVKGSSKVTELLYPDRMKHWKELRKMGVKVKLERSEKAPLLPSDQKEKTTPNVAEITGPQKLHGAKVHANDVRAGAALVIAGLLANGKTEITGIEQIKRGYEDIKKRLKSLGVKIDIVSN